MTTTGIMTSQQQYLLVHFTFRTSKDKTTLEDSFQPIASKPLPLLTTPGASWRAGTTPSKAAS